MKKKRVLLPLLSGLLLAPTLLAYHVEAEEQLDSERVSQISQSQSEGQAGTEKAEADSQINSPLLAQEAEREVKTVSEGQPFSEKASEELASSSEQASGASLEPAQVASLAQDSQASGTTSQAPALSKEEALKGLLQDAVTDQKILGSQTENLISLARSLGMLAEDDSELKQPISLAEWTRMSDLAQKFKEANQAEKKAPLFLNGKAQPIFPYSSGALKEGYSNKESDIARFTVYVETDYDTDMDGKPDLVKTLVQLPKAALKGDYQAATIFEARPYIAGTTGKRTIEDLGLTSGCSFDMDQLYRPVAKRQAQGFVTSQEHADQAQASDWYYYNDYEQGYDFENLNWYDYFLVRGFAVVTSAGLGTHGSEGINTTGSDLEIAAFKNIIEWLTGKRTAYTDREGRFAIKADWSNGKVGMTGLSWAGTTTFGVATTGVEGLKTIVPAAGIASWYDYLNSQGSPFYGEPSSNLSWLSTFVASRILNPSDWEDFKETYANYISQLDQDQKAQDYNYSPVWQKRDYTLGADKIKTPALILHGLNDTNVKTKHFELMYEALKKAGQTAKLYLHQGEHAYPVAVNYAYGLNGPNQESFFELLNRWFSHYLYDVANDVEGLPTVMAQDNDNPSHWTSYDQWGDAQKTPISVTGGPEELRLSSDYPSQGITWENRDQMVLKGSSKVNANFVLDVPEDLTIKGRIPLHFQAALAKGQGKNLQISALLVDMADQEFDTVSEVPYDDGQGNTYTHYPLPVEKKDGFWLGSNLQNLDLRRVGTSKKNYKIIASAWGNLRNPEADWTSASASTSIDPQVGQYHDYTLYLQPTVYKLKKGHRLALVLMTYDASSNVIEEVYELSFKRDSILLDLPTVEGLAPLKASYLAPKEADPELKPKDLDGRQEQGASTQFAQVEVSLVRSSKTSQQDQPDAARIYRAPAVLPETGSRESLLSLLGSFSLVAGLFVLRKKQENF
ncbi:CocE/NonD family hydrolase [Streptococcus oricebi]|uniref:X-prolyl-dipeptidyl aminopeptidase n=1 Tax=Streptococcus oricebi TaxID=1547447 RepID=A0ABS5B3T8_9STRE|nr:CocE/NonD family hydrolase [Streptococcus oricebi]MBP2623498.1 X-prolyl-dipeptidyl aminopeptidase [Streptococcus oricebi]